MESFTGNNTDFGSYTILGKDLTTMIVQPGFVEGIVNDQKNFETLSKAYRHIFRNNKEYLIILWYGLPIKFSYIDDLPDVTEQLAEMLHEISNEKKESSFSVNTQNLEFDWDISINDESIVTIKADFKRIKGNYQDALQKLSLLKIHKDAFLSEWKLFIEQLLKAQQDAGCKLKGKRAEKIIFMLQEISNNIANRGVLYQYDKR